jgi:hypothetical protein
MGNRKRFCAIALLTVGALVQAAGSLRIVPIVRDKSVIVSVELTDAYTQEVREAIASGLKTTVTYDLELKMDVPVWVDRTIATAVVTASDQYDSLTRRHNLVRTIDGRLEEARVTDDDALARRWLVSLTDVPLCKTSTLDPNREYYVRISARVRPPGATLLGFGNAITNQVKFTFIP